MKNLEAEITEIVSGSALVVDAGIAHPALGATPAETVKKIMEAISNYVRSVEEATCFLLELLPDNEISIKRQVTETCALIYAIKKE